MPTQMHISMAVVMLSISHSTTPFQLQRSFRQVQNPTLGTKCFASDKESFIVLVLSSTYLVRREMSYREFQGTASMMWGQLPLGDII